MTRAKTRFTSLLDIFRPKLSRSLRPLYQQPTHLSADHPSSVYFGAASVTLQLLTFSGKAGRFPWSVSLFQYRLMRKLAMDFTLPVMLISVGW